MTNDCNIITDILPLYIEEMVSDETEEFVKSHLSKCPDCQKKYIEMKNQEDFTSQKSDIEAIPLKKIKIKLMRKRIRDILFTISVITAIFVGLLAFLTKPSYIDYSTEAVKIGKTENGAVILSFDSQATRCSISERHIISGTSVYFISAWYTLWDLIFPNYSAQNILFEPMEGEKYQLYYNQGHDFASRLLSGNSNLLVTRSFNFWNPSKWIIITCVIGGVLMAVSFLLKNLPKAGIIIGCIGLIPLSAGFSIAFITGFVEVSYAAVRDFDFFPMLAVPVYFSVILGIMIYRDQKNQKK